MSSLSQEPVSSTPPTLAATVDRIVQSRVLSRSTQLKQLLLHLREATESGDETRLTETAVGVNFFQRADFSPKVDTIVRSEMVRLRRKLDEFYSGEGAADRVRLAIDKNVYRLLLAPQDREAPPELAAPPQVPPPRDRFWTGVAAGLAVAALVSSLVGFLLVRWRANPEPALPPAARSPLWSGFVGSPVEVRAGSALFFKFRAGYERNWDLNFPADVHAAKDHLKNWPAMPVWDKWAAFGDVATSVEIDRFLHQIRASASFLSAREGSIGNLAGRRTIVLGHPRFAPLVGELLADLDFRSPNGNKVQGWSGFLNANPQPGEPDRWYEHVTGPQVDRDSRDMFLLNQVDESGADFGLITSIKLPGGGEVLSIFGDRTESSTQLIRTLTTPAFLDDLNARIFHGSPQPYKSVQIVVRIDYIRGKPTGLLYQTHRIRY